ncbi:MAG: nucleotidyltransferase family protein [Solirubrobacteraceae bacterium]
MTRSSEPTIGGLVLAAGEGRRFGGTKQLAELRGRPLLEYAVESMLAVPAIWPVVVVLGHDAERIRPAVAFGDARTVVCEDWSEGQSASLRCGVAALGPVDGAVVTLGDQPFITPQVIAAMLDHHDGRHDAVRATYGGDPGHPVLLSRRLLDRVDELEGDEGFRGLLEGRRVRRFEAGHLCDPTDIDTREELARR